MSIDSKTQPDLEVAFQGINMDPGPTLACPTCGADMVSWLSKAWRSDLLADSLKKGRPLVEVVESYRRMYSCEVDWIFTGAMDAVGALGIETFGLQDDGTLKTTCPSPTHQEFKGTRKQKLLQE